MLAENPNLIRRSLAPRFVVSLALIATLVVHGCGRDVNSSPSQLPGEPPVAEADHPPAPSPPDPRNLRESALLALETGDLDSADGLIRASLSAAPDDPESIFLMALILGQQNRFPEAILILDRLAATVPSTRLPVLGQTADLMVKQGQWREAEERYRKLMDLVPDAMIVHRMLAQLFIRQGRRLEAAQELRLMCRRGDVEEAELRTLLMLVHSFKHDATIAEFDPVWALGDARFQVSQEDVDAAVAILEKLPSKRPAETALLGRLYAQQQDFESLAKWVADASQSDDDTADHWFAMGAAAVHQDDHRAAVRYFCEAVLRDQTDAQAYLLLSRSLDELEMDSESKEAARRADLITRTQRIGNEMSDNPTRDLQKMQELIDLLGQLHRPFEALAWRAVRLLYSRSTLSESEVRQAMVEINRRRVELQQANQPDATEQFLLCGVDRDALPGQDVADTRSDAND